MVPCTGLMPVLYSLMQVCNNQVRYIILLMFLLVWLAQHPVSPERVFAGGTTMIFCDTIRIVYKYSYAAS